MNTAALKVVLDTNILVASIGLKSPFHWVFDAIVSGQLSLCVSNDMLFEYREIIERKTNGRVAENVVSFITVSPNTNKVDIYFNFGLIIADESDNKFVDCAIASNALCIVTNDRHFQGLKDIEFPRVNILTLAEFEAQYRSKLGT